MKKSLLLAGLLSASAMMAETQFFVGAGFERGDVDQKASGAGMTFSESVKDNALKLKAGIIADNTHRVSLSYAGYSKDGGDIDLTLLNYDYLIQLPYEKTKLFVGSHTGISSYDEDSDTVSDTAFSYGLQAGILFDITSNISFETYVAYTKLNLEDNIDVLGVPVKVEIDDATTMGFGINYKF